jgi:hypothetical protein
MAKPESRYGDTPTSYRFPRRYLSFFAGVSADDPIFAILYEPGTDEDGRRIGRKSYVAWATITTPPRQLLEAGRRGETLWQVDYVGHSEDLPQLEPWAVDGEPLEDWLRAAPEGQRSVRMLGASVRAISVADAQRILQFAYAGTPIGLDLYQTTEGGAEASLQERTRRLVSSLERDSRFRGQVLGAYDFRCSITGLSVGTLPAGRSTRLIEAAHIHPASQRGPDDVRNGLALSPTLHRLFDEGLFTIAWHGNELEVRTSPHLERPMVEVPERGVVLPLHDGLRLLLPADPSTWPSRERVRYHQSTVFRGELAI